MNTNKKSYNTPTTDMQLLIAVHIICESVVRTDVVTGGDVGGDPTAPGMGL